MVISHAGTGLHDITANRVMTGAATRMDSLDCCTVCCGMTVITFTRVGKLTVMVAGKFMVASTGVRCMTGYTFTTMTAV